MLVTSGYWKDWEVYIESGGERLPEHAVTQTPSIRGEPGTAELSVECVMGEAFTICAICPTHFFDGYRIGFDVDGQKLIGFCANRPTSSRKSSVNVAIDGELCERPLLFAKLDTTEDGSLLDNVTMGVIKVSLGGGRAGDCYQQTLSNSVDGFAQVAVHEKKKVMNPVAVGLGAAQPRKLKENRDFFDDHSIPGLNISFKYRPRPWLIAEGIIPASSRSSPTPEAASPANDVQTVKRERAQAIVVGSDDENDIIEVKQENAANRATKKRKLKRNSIIGTSKATAIELLDD